MNIKDYFRTSCNKRKVHLEQLQLLRNQAKDEHTRKKLDTKIAHEQQQLQVIDDIWRVSC